MTARCPLPVWCSDHVLQRLAERCPELVGVDEDLIAAEVAEALAEHRFACTKPRAIVQPGERRSRAARASSSGRPRFVWTEDGGRVYLVRRASHVDGERGWLVVTVYRPLSLLEAAA